MKTQTVFGLILILAGIVVLLIGIGLSGWNFTMTPRYWEGGDGTAVYTEPFSYTLPPSSTVTSNAVPSGNVIPWLSQGDYASTQQLKGVWYINGKSIRTSTAGYPGDIDPNTPITFQGCQLELSYITPVQAPSWVMASFIIQLSNGTDMWLTMYYARGVDNNYWSAEVVLPPNCEGTIDFKAYGNSWGVDWVSIASIDRFKVTAVSTSAASLEKYAEAFEDPVITGGAENEDDTPIVSEPPAYTVPPGDVDLQLSIETVVPSSPILVYGMVAAAVLIVVGVVAVAPWKHRSARP